MKTLNEKRLAAFGWLPKALLALPFVFAAALGGAAPAYSRDRDGLCLEYLGADWLHPERLGRGYQRSYGAR